MKCSICKQEKGEISIITNIKLNIQTGSSLSIESKMNIEGIDNISKFRTYHRVCPDCITELNIKVKDYITNLLN